MHVNNHNRYGSYEICNDPYFSSNRLSLLDRGWVFAIAHIRGGELGRRWYEDGKMLKKKATFTDFIACAEQLITLKYTSTPKLSISGRSAGGMLMGAVTNMRPDLFHAVIMGVPFVDCLTTMLDPTIPLTVVCLGRSRWGQHVSMTQIEEEEWGSPTVCFFVCVSVHTLGICHATTTERFGSIQVHEKLLAGGQRCSSGVPQHFHHRCVVIN